MSRQTDRLTQCNPFLRGPAVKLSVIKHFKREETGECWSRVALPREIQQRPGSVVCHRHQVLCVHFQSMEKGINGASLSSKLAPASLHFHFPRSLPTVHFVRYLHLGVPGPFGELLQCLNTNDINLKTTLESYLHYSMSNVVSHASHLRRQNDWFSMECTY